MLCLDRKVDQEVIMSDGVTIKVLSVDRGRVKLGFTGPKEIVIDRKEIYEKKVKDGTNRPKKS